MHGSAFALCTDVCHCKQGSAYGLAAPAREAYGGRRLTQAPVAEAPVPEAGVTGALSSHSRSSNHALPLRMGQGTCRRDSDRALVHE